MDRTLEYLQTAKRVSQFRQQSGFTLIEVMMAMSVLVVGLLGVMALIQATERGVSTGRKDLMLAETNQMWIDYAKRDALAWNSQNVGQISAGQTTLFNDLTTIAANPRASTGWVLPPSVTIDATRNIMMSPCRSFLRENVASGSPAHECTHLRYTWIVPLELLRIDARTINHRAGLGQSDNVDYSIDLSDPNTVTTEIQKTNSKLRTVEHSTTIRVNPLGASR